MDFFLIKWLEYYLFFFILRHFITTIYTAPGWNKQSYLWKVKWGELMTPVHVGVIRRDMTPTLFQLHSRKHSVSGQSMVCSVDQRMAVRLRSHSQAWSSGLTELKDLCYHLFKTSYFGNPRLREGRWLSQDHTAAGIFKNVPSFLKPLCELSTSPTASLLLSGGLGSFSRHDVMITLVE